MCACSPFGKIPNVNCKKRNNNGIQQFIHIPSGYCAFFCKKRGHILSPFIFVGSYTLSWISITHWNFFASQLWYGKRPKKKTLVRSFFSKIHALILDGRCNPEQRSSLKLSLNTRDVPIWRIDTWRRPATHRDDDEVYCWGRWVETRNEYRTMLVKPYSTYTHTAIR